MKSPLRVTIITRRHLIGAACLLAFLVVMWQGAVRWHLLPGARAVIAPTALSMSEPVRQIPDSYAMALTINVDWGNEVIPELLDLLDDKDVKATFFLTGRWAAGFPDMARLIADRGHEIGNHGRSHAHPTQLSDAALDEHIGGNASIIKGAIGVDPVPLYAPPYGEQNHRVVEAARRNGHWTTLWTLDTIDWQDPPPATIVQRIVPRATGGAIVLMHPKPQSVAALPTIIDGVREKGLTWMPLYEMIKAEQSSRGQQSSQLLPED